MRLCPTLTSLLVLLGLYGICTGFVQENCINYIHRYDRVYSVPGDVAMLNSDLLSRSVFDFTSVLYNFTWYNSKTNQEIKNESSRILILNETLWFLKTTLDDKGKYMAILRTPSQCFIQTFNLDVDQQVSGECWRPKKAHQTLSGGVNGILSCPLRDYIDKLHSYNITSSLTWLRGCDPIKDWTRRNDSTAAIQLYINEAGLENNHFYTCTLTFTLGGVTGSISETIKTEVTVETYGVPQVQEPSGETIKAQIGSSFRKQCLVFVPSVGNTSVTVIWFVNKMPIPTNKPTQRIYTTDKRNRSQDVPVKGIFFERVLIISELKEEDFHLNYTCHVFSDRGSPQGYFTLLPADPNILLPIGLVFGGAMVLFIASVIICYVFKVDIVLWFRRAFPGLYANTDLDSKLYDAYVAYPQPCDTGFSEEIERFAIHTLPKVLENSCGYQLFIAGRDCLPGEAIVDSVEESLKASRCVLLLYTASTFISKKHTGNDNKISKSSNSYEKSGIKTKDESSSGIYDGEKEFYPDAKQQFTCAVAMHKALMEGSLKVILVELEEISPDELALLPESVRQLRKEQGAVRLWKNQKKKQRSGTCMWNREDEEKGEWDTQLSPALSPSSRFWKEMRYHMPVKSKKRRTLT
ncbi:interleukin-1 receptor-like 2 [Cheilinus undulatus]|uniref:interleukin-1 receptor-like 2 n=1 Tax=Cheilinus undulatus TaxID=241271 RepID=UPI001BD65C42|nr:interleukin-1 receptor-like 2 [Cheilinus undulatus]